MKNKARIVYRAFYSIISILSFSVFLFFVIISIQRLLRYETSISLDVKSTAETEFPAFTICPQYEEAYKKDILSQYGSDPGKIRDLIFPKNANMSANDFFEMVTYSVNEIVKSVEIKVSNKEKPGKNSGEDEVPIIIDDSTWISQTYILFGRCYTYAVPDEYVKSKVNMKESIFEARSDIEYHIPD